MDEEEFALVGQGVDRRIVLFVRRQGDGVSQNLSDIVFLRAEGDQFGEIAVRYHLSPLLFLDFFQDLRRFVQVGDLHNEVLLPDLLDGRFRFVFVAGVVEIALGVFVVQETLRPRDVDVHQRPVLGDVLFLDHADLLEKPSAEVGEIELALVHIVVHRLLFRRGDDGDLQFDQRGAGGKINVSFDVVRSVAVFGYRRSPGGYFGVVADQSLGVDALFEVEEIGVAIEVVEVL